MCTCLIELEYLALFLIFYVLNVFLFSCLNRREREFKVTLKFASKPDLHHLQQFLRSRQQDVPQETIQLLDVVLRAKPSEM